ncbi:MAG: CocE/NonD family hydrolase [Lentisphaeria bacterium]|nr:CocE/NonD family hydrolase [Lentisphaeria bacterium]
MSKDIYNVLDSPVIPDISCDIKMLMLPMRDGVRLHTAIYFPPNMPEKAPVVLARSPYCRRTWFELPHAESLKRGCVHIMQSVRGTAFSEGEFLPADAELQRNDTEDLLKYLETQSWYNGRCVMFGGSFPGYMQWCALQTASDAIKAVSPRVAPMYGCRSAARPGGGAALGFDASWTMTMYYRCRKGFDNMPSLDELGVWSKTPVIDYDKIVYGHEIANFRKFFESARTPGKVLKEHKAWFKEFKSPAFIVGGWFDLFKDETVESFQLMREAKTEKAREFSRLTIGPWGHGGLLSPEVFGAENNYNEIRELENDFLFGLVNEPEKDPLPEYPMVNYFMLGENRWYKADTWPPAGGVEKKFYLHSEGNANSCRGDGRLDLEIPHKDEASDSFVSDPRHPVSPIGMKHNGYRFHERKLIQEQNDVLVYSSDPLDSELTVAGNVKLSFWAAISTPDTDFFATLTDVTPDGKCFAFTFGMLRARFADDLEQEKLITPGEIRRYEIDLGDIAVKFQPGHQLRLDICGQNYPMYDRNANTGKELFTDEELLTCEVKIFHDAEHPAILTLPVNDRCIPRFEDVK